MVAPDDPGVEALTPERVAILVEFADNVAAGRRLMKWIAWLGGAAIGIAALVYYLIGIWNGWHTPGSGGRA